MANKPKKNEGQPPKQEESLDSLLQALKSGQIGGSSKPHHTPHKKAPAQDDILPGKPASPVSKSRHRPKPQENPSETSPEALLRILEKETAVSPEISPESHDTENIPQETAPETPEALEEETPVSPETASETQETENNPQETLPETPETIEETPVSPETASETQETENNPQETAPETPETLEETPVSPETAPEIQETEENPPETLPEAAEETTVAENGSDILSESKQNPSPETENAAGGSAEADIKILAKDAADTETSGYSLKMFACDILDLIECIISSVFVVMIVFTFLFCVATVDGESMVPTLLDGDRLIIQRVDKHYERGDILIISSENAYVFDSSGELQQREGLGKRIVKRLIAKEGDTVQIDFQQGIVSVNGEPLFEPYINTLTNRDEGAFEYPITVPEGYIFVLGDNRSVSKDSRHPDVGLIPEEDVIGEAVWRIAPLNAFGSVN